MGKKRRRPQYNLWCGASGKQVVCKMTLDDKVTDRVIERGVYLSSSRRIECRKGDRGFNCVVK
jgi:hypothetical protein